MIRPLHPSDAEPLYELFRAPMRPTCDHFEPAAGLPALQALADKPQGDQHRLVIADDGWPEYAYARNSVLSQKGPTIFIPSVMEVGQTASSWLESQNR